MTTSASGLPHPDYFILASTSPRRRQFLQTVGIPFSVIAPGAAAGVNEIDETPLPGEPPEAMVTRLSLEKAKTIVHHLAHLFPDAGKYQRLVVIAADTLVVLNGKILGKPTGPVNAVAMLKQLRQQPHAVLSGLTAARLMPNGTPSIVTRLQQSTVRMRAYTDAEIDDYVNTGSPLDKAGAYGIQDQPFNPVEKLEGCFAGVMGFPLAELAAGLEKTGLSLPKIFSACAGLTGIPCCHGNQGIRDRN